MIVERIVSRRVLGSSLTVLALVMSSSVVRAQQPVPQPEAQPPQQQPRQSPGQESAQVPARQAPRASEQPPRSDAPQQQEDVQIARAAPPAPPPQPMLNAVRVVQVKHDRVGEFEGLIKELRTAIEESGQPGFTTWSVVIGDLNTYHFVMQLDSFASLARLEQSPMEPVEWANWQNRIGATIESNTMIIGQMRPELSIVPPEQGQAQPPELMLLIRDTVMAGKTREYETFVRDELVPALRQANVDAMFVTELMFGDEGRTWVFAVPLAGWQVLDGPSPFVEALGPEAAEELMLRGDALVDESKAELLVFRADLSVQSTP